MAPCPSFAVLQANETIGADYRIRVSHGRSGIAVMAIHGGGIEPGTTEIAEAVAGEAHTFYSFSGLKPSGNACLHISSRKFDEPLGLDIARRARTVITIHGCRDTKAITYLGGRHHRLKLQIKQALTAAGFAAVDGLRFPGTNPKNICNKNRSGMGVQLEISIGMRKRLFEDITRLHRKRITPCFIDYVHALQCGIEGVQNNNQ
ncbi:MAG: poly-gamma-glutamate hydrolase family protein [Deltaproteobacteria bacterium]|nr:poly-gamma-glutamate hydrolase family protein [Deltaproteobacteria bacterium]